MFNDMLSIMYDLITRFGIEIKVRCMIGFWYVLNWLIKDLIRRNVNE